MQDFYTKIIYLQEKVNIKINLFCGNKLQFHNFAQKKIRFSKFSILKFKIFTKKFASFNSYLKYMNNSFSENFSKEKLSLILKIIYVKKKIHFYI